MTISVQNTVTDPSGSPVAGATVSIRLVTGNAGVGYTSTGDIIGPKTLTADGVGHWSQALVPNSTITPAGTFYEVTETTPTGAVGVSRIVVPAVGGPYNLSAILGGTPPSPAALYVPVSAEGAANGVATLDATGQVPASQLANAPGGTGSVLSVNGRTGAVVLAPADVNNANVSALAALDATTGLVAETAAGTFAKRTLTAGSTAVSVTNGAGVLGNPTVDVVPANLAGIPESGVTGLVTDLAGKVPAATLTAKGDLYVATAAATVARLPVGSNSQVLTADSTQAAGVKWAAAAAGGGMDQIFPLAGYNLKAASGPPGGFMSNGAFGANTIFFTRIWIPAGVAITNLWISVRLAGVWDGTTTGNTLGLYDDTGVKVDSIADAGALWTSAGWRGGPLLGGVVAAQGTGRFVYIAPLYRGMTTGPNVAMVDNPDDNNASWFCVPVGGGNRRCTFVGGQTVLPASFAPTTAGTATTFMPLVGVN